MATKREKVMAYLAEAEAPSVADQKATKKHIATVGESIVVLQDQATALHRKLSAADLEDDEPTRDLREQASQKLRAVRRDTDDILQKLDRVRRALTELDAVHTKIRDTAAAA